MLTSIQTRRCWTLARRSTAKVEFPSDAEEPIIQEQSTSEFPILQVNLVGDVPERMLYNIALDLRDAIEAQPGICQQHPANAKS